jgi:hypothetical protein
VSLRQIVVFGLVVVVLGLLLQLVHPGGGIGITTDARLYFPSVAEVFTPADDRERRDAMGAILSEDEDIESDAYKKLSLAEKKRLDSIRATQVKDSIRARQLSIRYPGGDKSILYGFFEALRHASQADRPVHIVHYGDSQIEGDRMTSFIRHKLQERFGGRGPGWLPAMPLAYPQSIFVRHSDNWRRAHYYGLRDSTVVHKTYGHMGILGRFSPYPVDSLPADTTTHRAWVSYKSMRTSYSNTKSFRDFRMFYGRNTQPVEFELLAGDSVVLRQVLLPGQETRVLRHKFTHPISEITLRFTGKESPDIYGVSLDGHRGVAVNNVGMRGDSGTSFLALDGEPFRVAFGQFDVRLIIMQFGGNAVPYAKTEQGIKAYGQRFKRNIEYMKRLAPEAAIIVIGPSDMSMLDGTEWKTYPLLPQVRDALKAAAYEAGAAYWDLYEAMGGKDSMKEWVNADPPLAIKDHAHFTDRGARKASQWFLNALIKDYLEYEAKMKGKSLKTSAASTVAAIEGEGE